MQETKRISLGFLAFVLIIFMVFACTRKAENSPDTLRINLDAEPPTLDWNLATDHTSIRVIYNIMEGLTEYDKDLNPIPALAERWDVSEDGKTYTFHLRKNVRWTDGVPLKASQFVDGWIRLLTPETAAEYAYFLFDVVGAKEFNSGKIKDPKKLGVKALDDHTLEVKLIKPIVFFPAITTFMVTYPIRKEVIDKHGDRWTEPGNIETLGPFNIDEWQHEYLIILSRNPDYFGPKPKLKKVKMFMIEEKTTALSLYERGSLDIVDLPPQAIEKYSKSPEYENFPFLRIYYYGFNVTKKPFDDVRVRKAFASAIDRSAFPKILKGGEIPASSLIPKGMFGYEPGIGHKFDPAKAKALLKEAGYDENNPLPEIEIAFNLPPSENGLIAENVAAQWRVHLGAKVKLNNQEWKVYLDTMKHDTPMVYRLGWGADYPDPDNFAVLFTSSSGNNHTQWGNPRYDELVSLAAVESDLKKRKMMYDEAQRILVEEDCAIVPLFISALNVLVSKRVHGYDLNAMDTQYLKKVSLSP